MAEEIFIKLKKILPELKRNVLLKHHTTFNIGGPANYFLVADERAQIMKALKAAKKLGLPAFILGGGSNILASDKGFDGLIIKIKSKDKKLKARKIKEYFAIEAKAGMDVKDLVRFSANNSLSGLEWAGGLPGTLGGAVRGNAGAFGGEIKDAVFEVKALDSGLNFRKLSNKECQFSYRSSIFKEKNWVVLSATLFFKKHDKKSIWQIAKDHMKYRKDRHPLDLPNAGSIFKNCDVEQFSEVHKKDLLSVVKKDPFPVVPVAYLLSEAGLKGKTVGGAQVSQKHPNFIVNIGKAKAADVLEIIGINKKNIKEKYGVDLEQEVQFLEN